MKQITLISLAISTLFGGSLLAGPPEAPVPVPEPLYGVGWYFAVDGGANVYQDVDRTLERTFPNGDTVSLKSDSNVGGWGGVKIGYVFGTGTFRPTIEEDLFYNGLDTDVSLRLNGNDIAHSSNLINSGAFMTNFIGRFSFGKFQPYAGGGVGAYYAAAAGSDITFLRSGRTFSTGGGASSASFAWQIVAGTDYYWTPKFSTFLEYKFLDYVALDIGNGHHQVGQHLVGAGIRFNF